MSASRTNRMPPDLADAIRIAQAVKLWNLTGDRYLSEEQKLFVADAVQAALSGPAERSTVASNVDGQNFYELCQQYRWAKEMMPPGLPNVVQAFDNLREYIKTGKLPWPSFEGDAPDAHP